MSKHSIASWLSRGRTMLNLLPLSHFIFQRREQRRGLKPRRPGERRKNSAFDWMPSNNEAEKKEKHVCPSCGYHKHNGESCRKKLTQTATLESQFWRPREIRKQIMWERKHEIENIYRVTWLTDARHTATAYIHISTHNAEESSLATHTACKAHWICTQ